MCTSTNLSNKRRRTSNPNQTFRAISTKNSSPYVLSNINVPLHGHVVPTVSANSFNSWSDGRDTQTHDTSFVASHRSVFEDYHIFPNVLGSGNYGCVRECTSRETGQRFAVKSIDKSKVGRLDHLEREVSLLREVNHPSIIKMVNCYEDSDHVHIVTEKYSGGEVFDKIVDHTTGFGCLSESEASRIIKSLLEAVAYLHDMDIVHRDIKPENMLLESKEDGAAVRLIDFGLSRRHAKGDLPMSNTVGTAYYTSPETIKGSYDRACDMWSVGVVAYILLAGYPPFNGSTDADIFDSIRNGRFNFHPKVWDNISDDAKDFILGLLRQIPENRFSAEEALRHPWIVANSLRRPRTM